MRYWAYVNNEILGPFEKDKLLQLPSFTPSLLICPQTPVGEKTEDWKEAASYPEISARLPPGTAQSAPSVEPPTSSAISADTSAPEQPSQDLKSLTPSPVETVPPKETDFGGIKLEVNHLERSGRLPSGTEQAAQSASSFDPISISSITKRGDAIAASAAKMSSRSPGTSNETETQPPNTLTPEPAQPAASDPLPQPTASAERLDNPGLENLNRKLEALTQNSASRQDITELTAPLRIKLEQLGEDLSGMKNSQLQREIMDKLTFLENSIVELKASIKEKAVIPQEQPPITFERSQNLMFGTQPLTQENKTKPAQVSNTKNTILMNQGKKSSIIGTITKKSFRFIITLLLLTSVLVIAALGLKIAGIFDFDKFLPFRLPFFITQLFPPPPALTPAAVTQSAQANPAHEAKPEIPKEPDSSPEAIYFARYYTASPNGVRLEDKIAEIAAALGGSYRPDSWQAKKTGPDLYEASTVISAKNKDVTFTYIIDYAKKTLLPGDSSGKAAFDDLTKTSTAQAKKPGRRAKSKNTRRAATPSATARPAPKPAAKPAPAKSPEDEYEYVYEDE